MSLVCYQLNILLSFFKRYFPLYRLTEGWHIESVDEWMDKWMDELKDSGKLNVWKIDG